MESRNEPPREWTRAEEQCLRELWPAHGRDWPGWESRLPGRTRGAIVAKAKKLGLRREVSPWTRRQLLQLLGYLRGAAAACGHEPAECVRMLATVAKVWETEGGFRRGSHARLADYELAELLADWRGGASVATLARRHGVCDRTVRRWIDEACMTEALRSVA